MSARATCSGTSHVFTVKRQKQISRGAISHGQLVSSLLMLFLLVDVSLDELVASPWQLVPENGTKTTYMCLNSLQEMHMLTACQMHFPMASMMFICLWIVCLQNFGRQPLIPLSANSTNMCGVPKSEVLQVQPNNHCPLNRAMHALARIQTAHSN